MTNVVPFERPKRPPVLGWLELGAFVDPNAKLEEGDLIACHFQNSNEIMFWVWYGPTGRDCNGRFIRRGDPRETFDTISAIPPRIFGTATLPSSASW